MITPKIRMIIVLDAETNERLEQEKVATNRSKNAIVVGALKETLDAHTKARPSSKSNRPN